MTAVLRIPAPRRRRPRLARRLLAMWLALAVIVPSVLGGARFAWCIPMARAQLHCCCHGQSAHAPGAHASHEQDAPRVRMTCCEGRRVESLPPSPGSHPPEVPVMPAPLVAFLTLEALYAPAVSPVSEHALVHARLPRAGPEPPLFVLNRAWLC